MKKSKDEMRTITKSMKLTPSDAEFIENQAKNEGMSFSTYVKDCALHRGKAVTPEITCKLQNIVNQALRITCNDLAAQERIRKEIDELWDLLK